MRLIYLKIYILTLLLLLTGNSAFANSTVAVSTNEAGELGDGSSDVPSISSDGRFIAFESTATNLVSDDTNGQKDVFVYDQVIGQITLVSVGYDGQPADRSSGNAVISADGRFIAFESTATNLVQGDTNGMQDIFMYDRENHVISLASVNSVGELGNDNSFHPSLSADGSYLAFYSYAKNLVANDTNNVRDIFVHDVINKNTFRVSTGLAGAESNGISINPVLTPDKHFVVFSSQANNLVDNDTNGKSDIFIYDFMSDTTVRLSLAEGGVEADDDSLEPVISSDGRFVAFSSKATNLVLDDTNNVSDIFVADRLNSTIERVSVTSTASGGNKASTRPSISNDGHYVIFSSGATNLSARSLIKASYNEYDNGAQDKQVYDAITAATQTGGGGGGTVDPIHVYIRDRQTGITTLVSRESDSPVISGDGQYVAFSSASPYLVCNDTNDKMDVFLRSISTSVEDTLSCGETINTGSQTKGGSGMFGPLMILLGIFLFAYNFRTRRNS